MAKFSSLILIVAIMVFFATLAQGQQKRKNVQRKTNKTKAVENVEAPTTNIFSEGSVLPEENENAWKEITLNQNSVRVNFPGKPAQNVISDKFAKRTITRTDYILATKRGTYILGFFSWTISKTASLSESYETFTKDLLAREGLRIKLKEVKDFSVGNLTGRELLLDDTRNIDTFRYRFILTNGKFYYISVMPSLSLSIDERRNAEQFFNKFFDSFSVFEETKEKQ
jgi:hypothetical protein